jgi:hypothetical protein
VYVEPSQILLQPSDKLFYLPNRLRFDLGCDPIRREVCDYKFDSCQLICMERQLTKDTEGQGRTQNWSEGHERQL